MRPISSILIKPSGADCNLDCEYCFYLEKAGLYPERKVHRMSLEVLEEMVKQAMRGGAPTVSFGWQGGEPTLMGLDFFKHAVEFQKKYARPGQSVGNGLQTNGTLLNDDWCRFLAEHNFLIGLSLDGPPDIHNRYRYNKGGRATHDHVLRAAQYMDKHNVEYNILTVVNNLTSKHPDLIWDYHISHGWNYMQFIPCVEKDPRTGDATEWSATAEDYGRFLSRIYDRWMESCDEEGFPKVSVRNFDSVFHTYVGMTPPECTLLKSCGCYVVVEHNGDVYSCDFFVEPEWKLGNIMETTLVECLNSPRQKEFGGMKAQLPPECHDCRWLRHCYGGCTKDRLRDGRDRGSNHWCKSYMMFFEHADSSLRDLAARWRRKQRAEQDARQRLAKISNPAPAAGSAVGLNAKPGANSEAGINGKVGRNDLCPCGSGKKFKKCCGRKKSPVS